MRADDANDATRRGRLKGIGSVPMIVALLLLGACATPPPLDRLAYAGAVGVQGTQVAAINILTGATQGSQPIDLVPMGTTVVPLAVGPMPELRFHADDQRAFGESLRTELVRLGLFGAALDGSRPETEAPAPEVTIDLLFARTMHDSDRQQYLLSVGMKISGDRWTLLRRYRIDSGEQASTWERLVSRAGEGKARAARMLLAKLIPDIEAFVALMKVRPVPKGQVALASD